MEACIDADEKSEALKYIPKLADPRERAEVTETCPAHSFLAYTTSYLLIMLKIGV